ncbi:hypothetical protein TELCIR_16214, partial [Teladorsagia circumcincta]
LIEENPLQAFQPVPEPAVTGGGKSVAFVKLITNIPVDDYSMSNAQIQEFLDDFSETKECIANIVEGETHQAVISVVSTLKWDPSQNSILQQLYERMLAPQLSQLGCLVVGKAENWSGNFVVQYVIVNTKCNKVVIAKQAIESETCCVKEVDVLCQ